MTIRSAPRTFDFFVVIDWSGQAVARPSGLAMAVAAHGESAPTLVNPERGWSRAEILEWLLHHANAGTNMLVGLDLSPALPFADHGAYFPGWADSPKSARDLWQQVDQMAAPDPHLSVSSYLQHPQVHRHFRQQNLCGDLFEAGLGRLRECERTQKQSGLIPSSCFNLIGAAQVGKSSLTGMRVLHRLHQKIPVWPFREIGKSGPAIVEVYTSLAAREAGMRKGRSKVRDAATLDCLLDALASQPHLPLRKYNDHVTDALLTAAWLRRAAAQPERWTPSGLTEKIAATEGWTFGVL